MISETLRMANIINAVWRKAIKDVEIKGKCQFVYLAATLIKTHFLL